MVLARRNALPCLRHTLLSEHTMSTMRLVRTLPSLPWLPLCTASCRELMMTPTLWPFGSSRGPSRAPLPALRSMHATLIAIRSLNFRGEKIYHTIWNARLVLATTGLHLAQFRHKHRPLAKAVDYAELFIYDEAQQEAALSDIAILGALPRKCLLLRLGDPRQTSGGTGPGRLAQEVRAVSDELSLGAGQPLQIVPTSSMPCCTPSPLMTSAGTVPKALMRVLA